MTGGCWASRTQPNLRELISSVESQTSYYQMTNQRAEEWLRSRQFGLQPEPDLILEGQKPDFLCTGPAECWVEVKTLDPAKETELLGTAFVDLRSRSQSVGGDGSAHALIGPSVDEKAISTAIRCLQRVIRRSENSLIQIVMIPADPDYSRWVNMHYISADGDKVEQSGPASTSGTYPCYPTCEPSWLKPAEIRIGKTTQQLPAHRLINAGAGKLALRLFSSEEPFRISSAGGFEATRNRSQGRVRDAIAEANGQIRNDQKYLRAPGIVCIYQETMDCLSDQTILAATLGDLTVPVSTDTKEFGETFLGRNGAFTQGQNRGVSALRYVGYGGKETFVVNPFAELQIDWRLFSNCAWISTGSQVELAGELK